MEIGSVVYSKQGHEKGRAYIVVGHNSDCNALVCDGAYRKLSNPKSKNPKHLKFKGEVEADVRILMEEGKLQDSHLICMLKKYIN